MPELRARICDLTGPRRCVLRAPTFALGYDARTVTLAGVDSVMAPKPLRVEAWGRLAADLDRAKLEAMTVTRPAADVVALAPEILAGKVRGRVVLELG